MLGEAEAPLNDGADPGQEVGTYPRQDDPAANTQSYQDTCLCVHPL